MEGRENLSLASELTLHLERTNEIVNALEEQRRVGLRNLKRERKKIMLEEAILAEYNMRDTSFRKEFFVEVYYCLNEQEKAFYKQECDSCKGKRKRKREICESLTKKMVEYTNTLVEDLKKLTQIDFYLESYEALDSCVWDKKAKFNTNLMNLKFKFVLNIR